MIKNSGAITSLNNWFKKLNYQIIVDKEIKVYYQNKEIFSKENKDAMNWITITIPSIPSYDCQYGYYDFDQIVKDHSLSKKLTK